MKNVNRTFSLTTVKSYNSIVKEHTVLSHLILKEIPWFLETRILLPKDFTDHTRADMPEVPIMPHTSPAFLLWFDVLFMRPWSRCIVWRLMWGRGHSAAISHIHTLSEGSQWNAKRNWFLNNWAFRTVLAHPISMRAFWTQSVQPQKWFPRVTLARPAFWCDFSRPAIHLEHNETSGKAA